MSGWLSRLLLCVAILGNSGCALMGRYSPLEPVERSLIFQPAQYPQGNWNPQGLRQEEAHFQAADGTHLHGWFLPHPQPRAVALFLHGNAGNLAGRAGTLWQLNRRHGLSVMTLDYRGYGKSKGKPSERGILQDARAARAWLAQRTGVAEQEIVLMGRSLGGAVAVDLASEDGARGLVLASTFSSLPDVAAKHFWWASPHAMMSYRLNSKSKIKKYHGPLLQSHGDADRTIPYASAQRLHKAAPGPKRFVTIAGGDHNDPQTEEYRRALEDFLDSLPPVR